MNSEKVGIIGQLISAVTICIGIDIGITGGSELSIVLITGGALLFALFTQIRFLR